MPLFGRKQSGHVPAHLGATSVPAASGLQAEASAGVPIVPGWEDIHTVRAEWPQSQLDADTDMRSWQEGLRLYENDDYGSMMRCATLFSAAVAHSLYGEGILHGADLPNTVHNMLYASLAAPPDGRTFADSAQRCARLALTIVRENGWQPASMGGSGLFDELIMDKGNHMLLGTAVAPADRPWGGDLKTFFAVPPQPIVVEVPDPRDSAIDRGYDILVQAEAGDEASQLHGRGLGLWMKGDLEGAMTALEEAARLGDAQAMKDAGDLAAEMGQESQARFWFESAANAGNGPAMWNMGASAIRLGDIEGASKWWQRAVEAGEPDGYAGLCELAHDRGDFAAELHWSRLGAEEGQVRCLFRYGLCLVKDAADDMSTVRRALGYLEAAAERGDIDGMLMAGNENSRLGDSERAKMWFDRARATGDPNALDVLQRYGW